MTENKELDKPDGGSDLAISGEGVRPSHDERCAECGGPIGGEWVSFRRDSADPTKLNKHFAAIVLAGPAEPPIEGLEPKVRDFRAPDDLDVFFHSWCAPRARLPKEI